jgi:hypothetical protein
MWVVYIPVFIRYGYDSLRLRSPFYFTAVNPQMEAGGLFGASKYRQLKQLPQQLIPQTLFCKAGTPFAEIKDSLQQKSMNLPLVVKPDRAERGIGISLCKKESELAEAISHQTDHFLVQEYISHSCEAGLFVIDHPDDGMKVVSLTMKSFLSITGNGVDSVSQLLTKNTRALIAGYPERLHDQELSAYTPQQGEEVLIEAIGNHNRGTAFIDACDKLSPALETEALSIANRLPEFHYGRLDIRCPSESDLFNGTHWKVLEVNGVNSEPAHIYQSGYPLLKAWKTLLWHWSMLATIAEKQNHEGFQYSSYSEIRNHWRNAQRARKSKV